MGPALALAQSLPQLYQAALASDPAVTGAQAQVRAAEERVVQARAAFGPTAAFTASRSLTRYREEPRADLRKFEANQTQLQVALPLLRTALFPALEAAQAQERQARAALDHAQAESGQRLVEACFELFKARDALELARAQRVATAEQLALARHSYKVGTAAITDVREAEAKADTVAAQVLASEAELELRQQVLAELTGQPAPGLLARALGGDRLPDVAPGSVPGWLAAAEDGSAQLQQAEEARAAAQAEMYRARHAHAPTAELSYNHIKSNDTGTTTSIFPRRGTSSAIGVSINIPLFASGATQAKVREAAALHDKAQSEVEAARRTVTLGVRQALSAVLSAVSQARALEVAVRSQELALRANRRGYEIGMKINAEVLEAQSKLFEARRDLSRARYDAWVNFIKLRALTGQLGETDIAELEALLVALPSQELYLSRHPSVAGTALKPGIAP